MKLEFHYAHYTRDFRKQEVLVQDGTLLMEFREESNVLDTRVSRQMPNIFLRVLRRFDIVLSQKASQYNNFGSCGFIEVSKDICFQPNRVWEKELGRKGKGDFIRITSTFPPAIQKRYAKEWDDYMDYLSMPAE